MANLEVTDRESAALGKTSAYALSYTTVPLHS